MRQGLRQSQAEASEELEKGARRTRFTLATMGFIAAGAAAVSMSVVYGAGADEQRARLRELASSQAHLIDAVARFDAVESRDANPSGAWVATLGQVAEGFARWHPNDSVVSMYIVGSAGGQHVVHVHNGRLLAPHSEPLPPTLPAPLVASALAGPGGEVEYAMPHGTRWLLVYEPIPTLEMAVLVRLNLDVVHAPLREAVAISALASLVLVLLGAFLARKTSVGTVQQLSVELRRRQQVEEELSAHRDALERTVRARTAELEKAQAELVAQARLATIGQVTAKVSHELRNPLGTVRSTLHTLRERVADEALERLWARAERNVERCSRIIGELLAFTRPPPQQRERVDVIHLVEEVLGDYAQPEAARILFEQEGPAELTADPEDLRRIVINLVNNAVAANKPGQESVTVRVSVRRSGGDVSLSVEDDGAGMDAAVLERAFEPLFSTRNFGVGLGLPIVSELVERNGGVVDMKSLPAQGTRVVVRFAGAEGAASDG